MTIKLVHYSPVGNVRHAIDRLISRHYANSCHLVGDIRGIYAVERIAEVPVWHEGYPDPYPPIYDAIAAASGRIN
jgi:hypothetical protein